MILFSLTMHLIYGMEMGVERARQRERENERERIKSERQSVARKGCQS
jgi:hypothetical protein